jgi:mono/diheme cytochrome c family protein
MERGARNVSINRFLIKAIFLCGTLLMVGGCVQVMAYEGKEEPLSESTFFLDGRSARPLESGTVARDLLPGDELLHTGQINGEPVDQFPFEITRQVLERGQERFNIFCSPCHGRTGNGEGMIVQRGFRPPPSYHIDRLRNAPAGHYFDVITNGFGAMASYASRVPEKDRWAIIAYIRVLQLSQNATIDDVPAAERDQLEGTQ